MLKRYQMVLMSAIFALAAALFAAAQENQQQGGPPPDQQQPGQHGAWQRGPRDPAQRLAHLTKALDLTSDQQAKIKGILEDEQKQAQAIFQEGSGAQEDRRSKMMALRQQTSSQIRGVLTPDQQKKFDAMEMRQQDHMGGHQHGQGYGQGQGQGQGQPPSGDQAPPPPQN